MIDIQGKSIESKKKGGRLKHKHLTLSYLVSILFFFTLMIRSEAFAESTDPLPKAVAFVAQLKDQVMGLYRSQAEDHRRAELCSIIESSSDLTYMADASLGRYRNRLNEDQKKEFRTVFLSLVTGLFDRAFAPLQDGEVFVLPAVQSLQTEQVVRMQVIRPSRSPLNLQFYLHQSADGEKLTLVDGASEGVRLVRVLQSSFDSQISDAKGDLDLFLTNLKSKNSFCLNH